MAAHNVENAGLGARAALYSLGAKTFDQVLLVGPDRVRPSSQNRKANSMSVPRGLKERLKRLVQRGKDPTQAAMADVLGVRVATVNEWLNGKRPVTAEMYVKMARKASEIVDKRWFLEKAGFGIGELREMAKLLQDEEEPTVLVSPVAGSPTARKIPVPQFDVPDPEHSAYAILGEDAADDPFRAGQVVVFDFSERAGRKLSPYWGEIVLVRFDSWHYEAPGGQYFRDGYRVGELVYDPEWDRTSVKGMPRLCSLNRLDRWIPLRRERGMLSVDEGISVYQVRELHEKLMAELEPDEQITVEGRILAWYPARPLAADSR